MKRWNSGLQGAVLCSWMVAVSASAEPREPARISPVVVTAPAMMDPGQVETDPRQPRLPLPAHDGASYLRSIPGFSASRRGGTSAEPVFRGQGGSRLPVRVDGNEVLGAGPGRMDPPTAYVHPEAFDRIEVTKGPQSVRHGAPGSGGVRFERDAPRLDSPTVEGHASTTVGRFNRNDLMADVVAGDRSGFVRMNGTLSSQDDFEDGDGREVRSRYERWSTHTAVGWTPDPQTDLIVTYDRGDGEALFDDRAMDGTVFDRTGYGVRATRRDPADGILEVDARLFHHEHEHVMDTFSFRDPAENAPVMGMDEPRVLNPVRTTRGGRVSADLSLPARGLLAVGVDYTEHDHTDRGASGEDAFGFRSRPRQDIATFEQYGAFGELEQPLSGTDRWVLGLRVDRSRAEARQTEAVLPMQGARFGGAEPGTVQRETLTSAFARYERELTELPLTLRAGLGRSERAPDFWERNRYFGLDPETLTQIDLGAAWRTGRHQGSIAVFFGNYDEYILVGDGMPASGEARGVDASVYGLEADGTWRFDPSWSLSWTFSAVRGRNRTDGEPLAQMPPAEGTLSLDYEAGRAFAGVLGRAVARQTRIHEGFGTIYSVDSTETPGFGVLSVYGGRDFTEHVTATVGIDNVLDRSYAEHIQRGSADLGTSDRRIPEPGLNAWARVQAAF